jgi:carbonic anhydrase/acetyltransferase-like protein (isoleucine patch superfamily)
VTPRIDPEAILLEPCVVVGDVEIGAGTSVWFHAVIRGDMGSVRIGCRTSIQDCCVLHEALGGPSCIVEDDVTVGHGAILHGCLCKRGSLIGMGATVLDGAVIEEEAMVGAGAMVPPGMVVPAGHLAVGVPAKVRRPLMPGEIEHTKAAAARYVETARAHRE